MTNISQVELEIKEAEDNVKLAKENLESLKWEKVKLEQEEIKKYEKSLPKRTDLQQFNHDINSAWDYHFGDIGPGYNSKKHNKGVFLLGILIACWASFMGF